MRFRCLQATSSNKPFPRLLRQESIAIPTKQRELDNLLGTVLPCERIFTDLEALSVTVFALQCTAHPYIPEL